MKKIFSLFIIAIMITGILFTTGCGGTETAEGGDTGSGDTTEGSTISGSIEIDGSSTVYPITVAVAEAVREEYPELNVNVAYSGTGGGMKKFTANEIPICDASREIKDEEIELCEENGIEYTEISVAYDGISIVVNPENDWCTEMSLEDLKKMWEPDSSVTKWSDINSDWPDEEISFYSPGTDSGTFEYFTEEIMGEAGEIRKDITPNEDDNTLVKGVEGDKNAIGYFGYAYYSENADNLNVVSVIPEGGSEGEGIAPTEETIKDGSYAPLSRPLFIYVNNESMKEDHINAFLKFYLENAPELVPLAQYVPLSDYSEELAKIEQ
jgi:phosphate transport system substrate-binding protein